MFERFTQKTVDIIASAQNLAQELKHNVVYSEHLLLALIKAPKGVESKILQMAGIDPDDLEMIILRKLREKSYFEKTGEIPFSKSVKNILRMAVILADENKSTLIQPTHLYLAVLSTQNFGSYKILEEYDFDREKAIANLRNLL